MSNKPEINLDHITADIYNDYDRRDQEFGGAASLPNFVAAGTIEPEVEEAKPFIRIEFDVDEDNNFAGFRLESLGAGETQEDFLRNLEMVLNTIRANMGEQVTAAELND
ncbi:MAG: hypothetical protein H9W81_13830 [Enterococcus sp.]|nr:hypothetical protein [Enterococcus sp.]